VHVYLGKGGKDRYVPLPQPVLDMLRQHWLTHRNPVWLFPSPNSALTKPMAGSGMQRAFQRALKETGISKPATIHTLRHSYGRSFGRLVNASKNAVRQQGRTFSPWQFRAPRSSGLVSFQGT
jgi:integrase